MQSDEPLSEVDACTAHCVHPETVRHVQARALPAADLTRVSSVFKLLGDPTRVKLLYAMLEAGELCVCDLAASTGIMEATVSQSLRLLRASQVVTARRDGRLMYYRLADAHVRMLLDLTREHVTHELAQASADSGRTPPSKADGAEGPRLPMSTRRAAAVVGGRHVGAEVNA